MLINAQKLAAGDTLNTDVCIIGAGPAGIAIALELNGQAFKVCLLESGGDKPDAATQALAEDADMPIGDVSYPRAATTRERVFGGTSTAWPINMGEGRKGVRYVPLDPIDFEKRDWVPHSGWPITRSDLEPYYERAHKTCQSGPNNYDVTFWQDETAQPIHFKSDRLKTQIFQFGARDIFSKQYRQELEASPNVTICLHATAIELCTNEQGEQVETVRASSLQGNAFSIKAKYIILATGGLEAPRLLLLSDQNKAHPNGLGNHHDVVGRYFMDHQGIRSGLLTPETPEVMKQLSLYDTRFKHNAMVTAKAVLSEKTLREERLLHLCAALYPRTPEQQDNALRKVFPKGPAYQSPAVEAARVFKRALKEKRLPEPFFPNLFKMLFGLDDLLYSQWRQAYIRRCGTRYHLDNGGWSLLSEQAKREMTTLEVVHYCEQVPDPDNRITLSDVKDALGCRKLQIHWRLTPQDLKSIRRAQDILVEEFAAAGLGRLKLELNKGQPQFFLSSIHHAMGTTRMHEDPKQGVVDAQCKVHGVDNLYIASSSVFTTGGYANPTLTIVALAIRVADQIKTRMVQSV
jgi:choline dehydrogenase-like flavoprotein